MNKSLEIDRCTPPCRDCETTDFPAIRRKRLETLQVNLGYKCNQSCLHCHVNAGPTRTEMMGRETVSEVIAFLKASRVKTARHHRRRAGTESAFPRAGAAPRAISACT